MGAFPFRYFQAIFAGLIFAGSAIGDIFLRLPTDNDALFRNKPEDFFMYVDRNFEGVKSKPWQGGDYGFTRTMVRTQAGPLGTKFHEGIDIKPVKRKADGTPIDVVHPVAAGKVVHVSTNPRDSSYGRYIVIEHLLPGGNLYSLYAHLADTQCQVGQTVGTGNVIGTLGFSGVGLNKERSHLHLEFCLLLQRDFETWYKSLKIATPNKHGIYNGMNLMGINPGPALKQCNEGTSFSLRDYLKSIPVEWVARVPATKILPDILSRYPILRRPGSANPKSWEIAFSSEGIPLSFTPSDKPCSEAEVIKATPRPYTQLYRTGGRVNGSSKAPVLTGSGKRYINLLMMNSQ